ncbi:MAG: M20/M25/M40 family metallo-hydrolase [Anaerolineales bacterium]|nr:M20/M25/M40 family metallo-hydrolase [Anaerolineales bacterium]NUQ84321.1 M20/M25/M40 family metallo-hydrolase [Anaerolineales bacterium]
MTNTIERIIELAIQIQQIAAPTFHERKRAEFVRGLFEKEGLKDVRMDEVGNVYGLWSQVEGRRSQVKPLVISAHLDTVFPFEMDLSVRREGERVYGIGIGDNSLGVAALLGLMWMLTSPLRQAQRDAQPSPERRGGRDVWFVANVGEEGLGDLHGMKAVVDRFGSDVLAYLVLEGMALGHVYHKAVGVKRYRITAKTQGGHSWSDYGQPSAVLELSKLVVQLSSLILPSKPRTTMNVGRINGGTSINAIPAEAWLELDLRSEGGHELAELVAGVERLIEAANKPGVIVEAEAIGSRPAGEMPADHPLVKLAQRCLIEQGLEATLTSGSTDANIPLSKGYPAIVLGVTKGGGAHTRNEFIETAFVEKGMGQLVRFVESVSSDQ